MLPCPHFIGRIILRDTSLRNKMMKPNLHRYAFLLSIFCLSFSAIFAQSKNESSRFCQNFNRSNGGRFSLGELREMTLPAGRTINVDARLNGNISVRGEARQNVLIRACVRAADFSDETTARNFIRGILVETGSIVRAESANGE